MTRRLSDFFLNCPVTNLAMSPQQRRFSAEKTASLDAYRELIVGNKSWVYFSAFEFYNLFFSNMPSIVGYGMRRLCLPLFLRDSRRNLTIGRGLTIRQPQRIFFGQNVIIDDYATLDVRCQTPSRSSDEVGIEIGNHVFIGRFSMIVAKDGNISLGSACNISSFCRIATQSRIEIGESVLIAAYAYIGPGNHRDDFGKPIIEQEMEVRGGVKIGANSWIGAHATVLDGVTIGKDVIVGAHSLVRENVPDRAVVAGIPARIIRYRE